MISDLKMFKELDTPHTISCRIDLKILNDLPNDVDLCQGLNVNLMLLQWLAAESQDAINTINIWKLKCGSAQRTQVKKHF